MNRYSPQTLVLSLILLTSLIVNAQDSHYWTLQYGPKSSLLGGAVIGSIKDISGTYYNPGALSLSNNLAFALSTDVFELSTVRLQDGGGEGLDLGQSKSGIRPSLIAGTFNKDVFGKGGVLAYSILTRSSGVQDFRGLILLEDTDIPTGSDFRDIFGLIRYEGEFDDYWAGVSYSHPLGSHFGIGATGYIATRSQSRRTETIAQGVRYDGTGRSIMEIAGGSYIAFRTILKVGAFAEFGPFTTGLTITTPSLHIAGNGELGVNKGHFGSDSTALAANYQVNLPAEYKNPLSIGYGLGFKIGKGNIHASVEWFDKIDPYFVMQGEDFIAQIPDNEIVKVDAVQEMNSVLNWAVGFEYNFSPAFNGYISFNTDQSGLNEEIERAGLSVLPIDIKNVNLGADFKAGPVLFTLGFGYGWGNKLDKNLTEILKKEDEDFQATFTYKSFRLLFGFEIGFNKNKKE